MLSNVMQFQYPLETELDLNTLASFNNSHYERAINELRTCLTGRSLLIMIEIANLGPEIANLKSISQILMIPQSTVTKEFQKLINLGYIKQNFNSKILVDNRYKFYSLTEKSISFLNLMKFLFCQANTRLNLDYAK